MKRIVGLFLLIACLPSCRHNISKTMQKETMPVADELTNYKGTASVTQGIGTTTAEHIYTCDRGRKTDIGEITSVDGKRWTVPASTNFQNSNFPFAPDLHNSCNGNTYSNAQVALSKIKESDVISVQEDGELFTAFIFGDNYFEMYINGMPVGKDPVPFTQFNSNIIQFKVKRPFTIAMQLVDWEEHLGIGCEANRGKSFHAGDGGIVAVIKDSQNNTVAITNENWKAQTFYTAPILDMACVSEEGPYRYSMKCDSNGGQDGTSFYALHWEVPTDWMTVNFDDSTWPSATTYTNKTIGVDNKPAYTTFTDIFDDVSNDAQFIWSTNVVLDNTVLVRYTVK